MINVALFGLGRIGQMHGENLHAHKRFKLKYTFDINKNLSRQISKKFNSIPIKNPIVAFQDKNIDIVFIASSTPTHINLINEATKYKKVVFCEKPLDLDIKKVNICKKKIKKFNPKIQLGFNRRYDPGHNSIKKDLKKGIIGTLEKIIITSRDPAPPPVNYLKVSGGIFKDMMIHDFDLARFFAGNDEFRSIFATGQRFSDRKLKKVNDLDLATVVMKTKKGVQCVITNSRHCSFGYDQRIELFGSKGMMISDNQRELETALYSKNSTDNKTQLKNFFIERYSEAYKIQLNDLVKICRKQSKPLANFEDGRKSLILAEIAKKSLNTKKFEKITF